MPKTKYPQPLGKSMNDVTGVVAISKPEGGKDEMYYPHVTLEWDKEYDLPESGTITFKFKKDSETTNPNPKPGQPKQRVELNLTSIEDVEEEEGSADDSEEEESGEVLDKAVKKLKGKSADEEADNGEGY